jgi:hypothetical protein
LSRTRSAGGTPAETALCRTLATAAEPPDEKLTGNLRYRVNRLLWSDLRLLYGQ